MKSRHFCSLVFCLAFSAQGCAGGVHSSLVGSSGYRLKVAVKSGNLIVTLANTTNRALASYGWFRAAGSGSAGLYLSLRSESGKKYHLCALIDQAPGSGSLLPHSSVVIKITTPELKDEYCLQAGVYTLRATYAVPHPEAAPEIVAKSRPVKLVVH